MTDRDAGLVPEMPSIDARRNPERDHRWLKNAGLLPGGWAERPGSASDELVTLLMALDEVVEQGASKEAELRLKRSRKSDRIQAKLAEGEMTPEAAREALERIAKGTEYVHSPEWWAQVRALELATVARGLLEALKTGETEKALAVAVREILSLTAPTGSYWGTPTSRLADLTRGQYRRYHAQAGGGAPKARACKFSQSELAELRAAAKKRKRDNPRLSQEQSVAGLSLKGRAMPPVTARHLAELLFNPRSRAAPPDTGDDSEEEETSGRS